MEWQEQSQAEKRGPLKEKWGYKREVRGQFRISVSAVSAVCAGVQDGLASAAGLPPFPNPPFSSYSSHPNVLWIEPSLQLLHPHQPSHVDLQHSVYATLRRAHGTDMCGKIYLLWWHVSVAQCY